MAYSKCMFSKKLGLCTASLLPALRVGSQDKALNLSYYDSGAQAINRINNQFLISRWNLVAMDL